MRGLVSCVGGVGGGTDECARGSSRVPYGVVRVCMYGCRYSRSEMLRFVSFV